eukprot:COSAG02_NODE_19342_length_886_cov_1.691233_1_plen_21_part_01
MTVSLLARARDAAVRGRSAPR